MASETMTEPNDDQVERTVAWDTRFKSADLRAVEPVDLLQIIPSSIQNDAPTTLMLRPTELWIDGRYQRDISRAGKKLILDIVENFSWHKFRAPVVTRDEEGRYVVIDGQHTAIGAASHPGIKKIPVSFIPMKDLREQALAFISHNTAKVNVPSIDLFFSKVTANDPTAVEVLEVLQKYGVSLARYLPSQGHYEPNQTIATGRLTMLFDKYSRTKFEDIIRTIAEMNLRPIKRDHLEAVATLFYESAPGDIKIDPELLAELARALNDTESLQQAERIKSSMNISKGKALAIYYRNRYRERYGRNTR